MKNALITIASPEEPKDWEQLIASASRRPVFISAPAGSMALLSFRTLSTLLNHVQYEATEMTEDDGSVTLSLDAMDIAVTAGTLAGAKDALASEILEYAEEYYSNFETYSAAPNRSKHLPYVMKALISNTIREVENSMVCRHG